METGKVQLRDIFKCSTVLEMPEEEKYLGGIILADGRLDKIISARKNKGQGLVNELSAILVELCLGQKHFETAILRNTILISSLIFNSEAWYGLTKNHINELAKIYEQLLRKITGCPSKTPICLLY